MEGTKREDSRKHTVKLERRYLHLQVVGMSFGLSILPAIMLADMFKLTVYIGQIATLLAVVGWVLFCFGSIGRQEQREQEANSDDRQR